MSADLLAALAARGDDLGPTVELRLTVQLRRWQLAEALGLLEAGHEAAGAAVLARHAAHAAAGAAGGEALLVSAVAVVPDQASAVTPRQGDPWQPDTLVVDEGPYVDLVHPARATRNLATFGDEDVIDLATPAGEAPSRWMTTFTRPVASC